MTIGDYPLYFQLCNEGDSVELDAEPFSYSCLIIRKLRYDDEGNISTINEFGRAICNDICCSDCILKSQCVTNKQGAAKAIVAHIKDNHPEQFI